MTLTLLIGKMITSYDDFLDSGLKVSDEIPSSYVKRALKDVELNIVAPRLGGELYGAVEANEGHDYDTYIDGGTVTVEEHDDRGPCGACETVQKTYVLAGLKDAITHLAWALLAQRDMVATVYGTVVKNDEYSENVKNDELRRAVTVELEMGMYQLNLVAHCLGAEGTDGDYNIFGSEWL